MSSTSKLVTVELTEEELNLVKKLVKDDYKFLNEKCTICVNSNRYLHDYQVKLLLLAGKLDNIIIPAEKL